jgi:CRISPR system Cascade subunit CasB
VRDVRFRRLMAVDDRDELFTMLGRLIRLLDDRVKPESLVQGTFFWSENIKRRWALQYYSAS